MRDTTRIVVAPVTVLVTGSRNWIDRAAIERALDAEETATYWLYPAPAYRFRLVHGACPPRPHNGRIASADYLAGSVARARGWEVKEFPANWEELGRSAGHLRNASMVRFVASLSGAKSCVGFPLPGSTGTPNCLKLARRAGIRTWTAASGMGAEPEGGE